MIQAHGPQTGISEEVSDVTTSPIDGDSDAHGMPGDLRRAWALDCTDAFGRPYVLMVTAYRAPGAGIGFKAPTGEYAFLDADRIGDLDYVLAEARRFIYQDRR